MQPHPETQTQMHGELDIQHRADGSVVITHQPHGESAFGGEHGAGQGLTVLDLAFAVLGGAAGWFLGGPVGAYVGAAAKAAAPVTAAVGAVAGGGLGWVIGRKKKSAASVAAAAPPPQPSPLLLSKMIIVSQANKATAPSIVLTAPIATAHMAPVPTPTALAQSSALAAAHPIPEATALQNYIDKYPTDREVFGASFYENAPMPGLISDFQTAFNQNVMAVQALGALPAPATGQFGPKTAAALMYFTHKDTPPDPNVVGSS